MSQAQWIGLEQQGAWDAALSSLPHAAGHRREFALAAEMTTGFEAGLWAWQGAGGRAVCCLLRRPASGGGFDLATPIGFAGMTVSGSTAGLAEAWTADWHARGAICAYVQLSSALAPAQWREALPALEPCLHEARDCLVWDLGPDPEQLLAAMQSKQRQLLRKWMREEPRLVRDHARLQAAFASLYAGFVQERQPAAAYRYPPEALKALLDAPGSLLLGIASAESAIEACMLFLSEGQGAESFLAAATPAGRGHARGLYWLGALALRERGVRSMNLGGGIAGNDALFEFKQRLGATLTPTLALRQVFNADAYRAACRDAGVADGLDSAGQVDSGLAWFPAYRSR